jgi:peptidoglycan/LPS O-acetylase OafA/YrhL
VSEGAKVTNVALAPSPASAPPRQRLDLTFVDGMRALAALTVTCYHGYLFAGHTGDAQKATPTLGRVLLNGHFAVPVFIVLSGFVLMLPVASRSDLKLPRGLGTYLARRARRILPPYYAALLLFLAMIWAIPVLAHAHNTFWDNKIPVTTGGIVSHLLLVHNTQAQWVNQIDGAMWSVATEWQLYFAMPILLIVWRRFGGWVTAGLAVVVGMGLRSAVPAVASAHYWYLGLFAMGMLAAQLVVRQWRPPGLQVLAALAAIGSLAVLVLFQHRIDSLKAPTEVALGGVVALGLIALTDLWRRRPYAPVLRVLQSRLLVWLGLFSYSIYLVHMPFLALWNLETLRFGWSPTTRVTVMLLVAVPLAVMIAWVFHVLIERRFMTSHQAKEEGPTGLPKGRHRAPSSR